MPCSDGGVPYENTSRSKDREDRLARIACAAMTALEELGKEDFLLLKNDEVREWWAAHKEFDRQRRAKEAETERLLQVTAEAMMKLTDEEKKVLGLI